MLIARGRNFATLVSVPLASSTFSEKMASFCRNRALLHTTTTLKKHAWGGGKLKSHSGVLKRFTPVGKRVMAGPVKHIVDSAENDLFPAPFPTLRRYGTMFKRGQTGKQHLNTHISAARGARLRKLKLHRSGPAVRLLTRLMGGN